MANNHETFDMLITNTHLATMVDGYGVIENGAVGIKDGRIAWVGKSTANPAKRTHDAKGKWLTPGLIDCHTHLVYAGNRDHEHAMRAQGKTYKEIAEAGGGILSTVRETRAASDSELLESASKRLQDFLREGVTTIEIKSGYGLDTASEIKMLRVARKLAAAYPITVRTTFLGAHAVPPEFKGNADGYVDLICNEMLPAIAKEKLADAVDGFCENIGFTPAQITRIFDTAQKLGLPVKLHAEQLSNQGGAALAAKYNALSADHLEYISDAGIAAMAKAKTVAVLLPGAFYTLKETHKPPVAALRKASVALALASDCNPGTSPITSLLRILHMGHELFELTPAEALTGVTRHAAKALGLSDVGTIEVGKQADLALWDIAHPDELSYHAERNPCRAVIRRGVLREVENG